MFFQVYHLFILLLIYNYISVMIFHQKNKMYRHMKPRLRGYVLIPTNEQYMIKNND